MTRRREFVDAASLVLDFNLYPRHQLDSVNIRRIGDAITAGEEMPPIIADRTSRRVVDGFHRVTYYVRTKGDVAVEWRDYDDDAAIFLDAIAINARHGEPLQPYDRARCLQLGGELGIDEDRLAGALAVNTDTLGALRAARTAYDQDGKPVTIKRSLRHLAGHRLTEKQVNANSHASGWSVRYHADQIAAAIEAGTVPDDEATTASLARLAQLLGTPGVSAA